MSVHLDDSGHDVNTMYGLGEAGVTAPAEGPAPMGLPVTGKPRPRKRSRVRLDDAIELFLGQWPIEGPRRPTPDTVRTYRWHLLAFARFAVARGQRNVDDALQPAVLRAALQAQMDETRCHPKSHKGGEAAANGLAQATRRLARWLVAQGVPVADLSQVKPPRTPERIQPRLRPAEFAALEQATLRQMLEPNHVHPQLTVARDLALLYLLYDTGLRCGEVTSMTIDDVDFDRGCVFVFRGKGNKQRALSIVDANDPQGGRTLRLLAEWIRARDQVTHAREHSRLWISVPQGRPLSRTTLRRVLQDRCVAAGLDSNRPPHAFRRANFTEHYRDDPRTTELLRRRMGWAEGSQMISIYTRGAEIEIAATQPLPSLASRRDERTIPIHGRATLAVAGGGAGGRLGHVTTDAADHPPSGRRSSVR